LRKRDFVPYRYVPAVCVLSLLAAFAIDLSTPQLFVAAILLDIPIVLSSLGGSATFRLWLVLAALTANTIAGYVNGVQDHFHWDAVGIGDRILSALSIVLVGYLSAAVSENAQRAGRAASQELRARREAQIGAAIERVRASLSTELVLRAIVHEALELFDASEARFALSAAPATTLVARSDRDEVDVDDQRLAPELISLVQRALDDGDVMLVRRSDALGRLVLDTFGAEHLVAIPIADGDRCFGALLVPGRDEQPPDDAVAVARAYASQCVNALEQARLFEQLAERNTALEERSSVIRDLVYALSHDLRTPLAALGMTLRQARGGMYGALPESYARILDQSVIATDDVQRLAETLLLVARFESGDRRPERETVDVGEVAEQIAGELNALAVERNVTLELAAEPGVRTVGDRSDLRRALTNLAANALDHTPAGGRVIIAIAREGSAAILRVTDDGFGVSDKARAHLFGRFARGDDRGGGGSGLGLYIARRVAEESGGTIAYEPHVPRGSIFTIRLPAATRA
jgi:signal transduction histidine kinase